MNIKTLIKICDFITAVGFGFLVVLLNEYVKIIYSIDIFELFKFG